LQQPFSVPAPRSAGVFDLQECRQRFAAMIPHTHTHKLKRRTVTNHSDEEQTQTAMPPGSSCAPASAFCLRSDQLVADVLNPRGDDGGSACCVQRGAQTKAAGKREKKQGAIPVPAQRLGGTRRKPRTAWVKIAHRFTALDAVSITRLKSKHPKSHAYPDEL